MTAVETTPAGRRQTANSAAHMEPVLEFCVQMSREMIVSGANLERVQLAIARICHVYGLEDISLHLLSTYLSLSARDHEGNYASRQCSVPPAGIHLERLKRLNRLSFRVAEDRPAPAHLAGLLHNAMQAQSYPDWIVAIAQAAAMSCLCFLFGGGGKELPLVIIVTVMIHYVLRLLARPGLDHIVTNAITMFVASITTFALMRAGMKADAAVILITASMLVIPGIPLVNAMRNLLCGNEMNGILQVSKVTVETLALAMGIYLAILAFGYGEELREIAVTPLSDPVLLILISFIASVFFGIVFQIPRRDLWSAGLGGMLARIALILLPPLIGSRLIYMSCAALLAALYGELMATLRRDPSTYFVYPSIIPLIPGDLFYFTLIGIFLGDREMFETNGANCLLSLVGLSVGFVLSSIIAHYIRKMRHLQRVKASKSVSS